MAVSLAAVAMFGWKVARPGAGAALGVLALTYSIAFVDYSTSGLENPLSHLILVVFLWVYLRRGGVRPVCSASLGRLGGGEPDGHLAAVSSRLGPDALEATKVAVSVVDGRGSLPLLLWLGFSLFYYGFLFPNTAYAKLNNGVPRRR